MGEGARRLGARGDGLLDGGAGAECWRPGARGRGRSWGWRLQGGAGDWVGMGRARLLLLDGGGGGWAGCWTGRGGGGVGMRARGGRGWAVGTREPDCGVGIALGNGTEPLEPVEGLGEGA